MSKYSNHRPMKTVIQNREMVHVWNQDKITSIWRNIFLFIIISFLKENNKSHSVSKLIAFF